MSIPLISPYFAPVASAALFWMMALTLCLACAQRPPARSGQMTAGQSPREVPLSRDEQPAPIPALSSTPVPPALYELRVESQWESPLPKVPAYARIHLQWNQPAPGALLQRFRANGDFATLGILNAEQVSFEDILTESDSYRYQLVALAEEGDHSENATTLARATLDLPSPPLLREVFKIDSTLLLPTELQSIELEKGVKLTVYLTRNHRVWDLQELVAQNSVVEFVDISDHDPLPSFLLRLGSLSGEATIRMRGKRGRDGAAGTPGASGTAGAPGGDAVIRTIPIRREVLIGGAAIGRTIGQRTECVRPPGNGGPGGAGQKGSQGEVGEDGYPAPDFEIQTTAEKSARLLLESVGGPGGSGGKGGPGGAGGIGGKAGKRDEGGFCPAASDGLTGPAGASGETGVSGKIGKQGAVRWTR